MPIASPKPVAPSHQQPTVPHVLAPRAQSNVVDTAEQPFDSMLKYIEGARWSVNYYSHIHGKEGQTHSLDTGMLGVYNQFNRIKGLEIYVDSPLSQEQDTNNKNFSVRGSGHVIFSVIPNEGDLFTADVGDGRLGIFTVLRSEKKSIFRESVYQIDYVLRSFSADDNGKYLADLDAKVMQELNYVHVLAESNQHPIISDDNLAALQGMYSSIQDLKRAYMNWFYSNEHATLLLPVTSTRTVYDPYLTKAIRSIFKTTDAHQVDQMKVLNVQDMDRAGLPTVWDALLRREEAVLQYCQKDMGVVPGRAFSNDPYTAPIFFLGIDQVVHPMPVNDFTDKFHNKNSKDNFVTPLSDALVSSLAGNVGALGLGNEVRIGSANLIPVPRISETSTYMFSKNFYDGADASLSAIELLTRNYLQGKQNDPQAIKKMLDICWKWGACERYYYIPVLFIIAEYFQRSF